MALDIGIYAGSSSKDPLERELVVSLEDGDLSFLYDVFKEIKSKTGVEIVRWDDARLESDQLDLFEKLLIERIEVTQQKDSQWDEYIGFQVKPRKKIYIAVSKSDLLGKLTSLRDLVKVAKEQDKVLFFFGD